MLGVLPQPYSLFEAWTVLLVLEQRPYAVFVKLRLASSPPPESRL